MTVFYLGEFLTAQEHLEQGIALYAPLQHHPHASVQDPGVACMSYAAWVLWVLGYPDQTRQRTHEMLTLAQELSHPYSLAFGLTFAAVLHSIRREERETQARAEAALQLATAQGFALWVATGIILRGWALTAQGQGEEGMMQFRQGLAAYRTTEAEVGRSY